MNSPHSQQSNIFVQLHSELADPTSLQLVGVRLCFSLSQEGRKEKEKKEGRRKEEITLTQPLQEGMVLYVWVAVRRMSENGLEVVWWVSGWCLEDVLNVSGGCLGWLESIYGMSKWSR